MFAIKLFTFAVISTLSCCLLKNNSIAEEIVVREIDKELIGEKNEQNVATDASEIKDDSNSTRYQLSNKTAILNTNKNQNNVRNSLNNYNDEFYDNFSIVDKKSKKMNKNVKFEIKMVNASETQTGSSFLNLKKAYNCYKNGDYELAVFFYKKAYEDNKESVESQFGLGASYQLLHQYDQAIEIYLDLLAKNFSRKKIVHNLLLCLKHKSYREALDILLSINENILGYSDILSQIGLIYMKLEDNVKALSAFNKAYEISPMNPIICYNLGVLYDKQNNIDYAKHFLELSIKNDIADILSIEDLKKLEKRMDEINKQILNEIKQNKKK